MSKYNAEEDPEIVLHEAGFNLLVKPSHVESNFAITGEESQIVTVQLKEGDVCHGEPGAMMYLADGVNQSIVCGGCLERCCSGESCCVLSFTSKGGEGSFVALTPSFPTAKVVPVNLMDPHVNGTIITQQGTYMASYGNVNVGISLDCNFCRCCFGGMGMVRQRIEGTGTVFLESSGTIIQKVLEAGETMLVDTNCLLAYSGDCKMDIRRAGGILGMLGGGEGIANTTITGPGIVYVQSMNKTMFLAALAADKMYRR